MCLDEGEHLSSGEEPRRALHLAEVSKSVGTSAVMLLNSTVRRGDVAYGRGREELCPKSGQAMTLSQMR